MRVIVTAVLALGLCVGGIILQIFLSKKESKWPGLLLPMITLLISLAAVVGIPAFQTQAMSVEVIENGVVIQQAEPVTHVQQTIGTGELVATIAYIFVLYNIPTAVLLAIYAACRGKRKRQRALEKMSIQDLE